MSDVIVVGAGLGGLAAALELGAKGLDVTVVEAATGPGGKAGTMEVDGVTFDTGPSVLTLPDLLRDLLRVADVDLEDVITLREPEPAFRYLWPDGVELDVHQELEATEASVRAALGPEAAADFAAFMRYSRRIWEAAAPYFVLAGAPSVSRMVQLGPGGLKALTRIDAFRSMWAAITAQVRSPHLRDLFARFATYNGSDVRSAPATLNCIAHVEMGLGSFGIQGGVAALPRALESVALSRGVQFLYESPVEAVETNGQGVCSVRLAGGRRVAAKRIVINADVAHLVQDLLPTDARHGLPKKIDRSTSGWTAMVRARPNDQRAAHTAVFPADYSGEFRDLFEGQRPPVEPTAYLCDQGLAHGRPGWDGRVPVFVMANAPATSGSPERDSAQARALGERTLARARGAGLLGDDDEVVWSRSPRGLAHRFPGSRGALYGAASNSMFAAFQRPPNRVRKIAGLYLASGSAHPGGGMPLCLQSGRLAADAVLTDMETHR